ncbi:L-amino acid N-acyltransferase YncA [Sinobacterium caligoides]|uniref:L-amino acid N-acyltransferase YncA n=1 Tax=Sinobacterium caligoides TaxID=933926 RepID=A0A3N2E081_9GAMM|nr:GNAT family N-acetyltransferase [Sinobacterium caligoides]ROS05513.1 L-amino acid N-acyltransferase YncA [Sinobacterium caligoides]
MNFQWVDFLNPEDEKQLVYMANTVAKKEKTVGFASTLNEEQAQSYINGIKGLLGKSSEGFFVARFEGKIIFHVLISFKADPNNKHLAYASKAIVAPEFRGKKIIQKALHYVCEKCEEKGSSILLLDARIGTPAEALWKRMGFIEWGVLPGYAKVNGEDVGGSYMYQTTDYLRKISIEPGK